MKINANLSFGAAIGLVIFVIVAVMTGADQLPIIIGFVAPWITILFAAAGINKDVAEVKEKVNGNYHKLVQRNRYLETQLLEVAKGLSPEQAQRLITAPIPQVNTEGDASDH